MFVSIIRRSERLRRYNKRNKYVGSDLYNISLDIKISKEFNSKLSVIYEYLQKNIPHKVENCQVEIVNNRGYLTVYLDYLNSRIKNDMVSIIKSMIIDSLSDTVELSNNLVKIKMANRNRR